MKKFNCYRCGMCCRQAGFVYLEEGEADKLAKALGMSPHDFTDQYCVLLERRHLVLRKLPDETCIFLGSQGCQVYEARPKQCRDFPHGWNTPKSGKYCEGLKRSDA